MQTSCRVFGSGPGAAYPRCIAGARACPPEDVGGPHGYTQFFRTIADEKDEDHDAMLEWVGGAFDPARFSAEDVEFDDPEVQWRQAFEAE